MAQEEIIFQEVDEELEAERLHKWWRANRGWVITLFVLFFAGLFAYVGWREWRIEQNRAASDLFIAANGAVEAGDWAEAGAQLDALIAQYPDHGYGWLSRLLAAKSLATSDRTEEAIGQLEALAADAGESAPFGQLALINAAYLAADQAPRARAFLARIGAESPFHPHALELEGLMAQREGDAIAALARFREAQNAQPADSLRRRLIQRIERLGGPPAAAPAAFPAIAPTAAPAATAPAAPAATAPAAPAATAPTAEPAVAPDAPPAAAPATAAAAPTAE